MCIASTTSWWECWLFLHSRHPNLLIGMLRVWWPSSSTSWWLSRATTRSDRGYSRSTRYPLMSMILIWRDSRPTPKAPCSRVTSYVSWRDNSFPLIVLCLLRRVRTYKSHSMSSRMMVTNRTFRLLDYWTSRIPKYRIVMVSWTTRETRYFIRVEQLTWPTTTIIIQMIKLLRWGRIIIIINKIVSQM